MPNDEYFELPSSLSVEESLLYWSFLSEDEKLQWTLVFLDYPPRFLGVIGMLATLDGYAHGKATSNSTWQRTAGTLARMGISPLLYLHVKLHITREMKSDDWRKLAELMAQKKRISVALRVLNPDSAKNQGQYA